MTDTTTPLPRSSTGTPDHSPIDSVSDTHRAGVALLISALATCALCCKVMAHRSRAIRASARHTPPTYTGAVIHVVVAGCRDLAMALRVPSTQPVSCLPPRSAPGDCCRLREP
jgi:hypothetical protein